VDEDGVVPHSKRRTLTLEPFRQLNIRRPSCRCRLPRLLLNPANIETPQTNKIHASAITRGSVDGQIDFPIVIPDDLGRLHGLALRNGEKTVALDSLFIETSIVSMTPTSGPVGTPITIHVKGVGWTEYDNIYVSTFDNAYMGYACGFNSRDVVINFTASGAPGEHLIDLYPGIYQGAATEPQLFTGSRN
jgi:hypothetical protein